MNPEDFLGVSFCLIFFFQKNPNFKRAARTMLHSQARKQSFYSAAILIFLQDLFMLFERICLSAKPKIYKLASLQTK